MRKKQKRRYTIQIPLDLPTHPRFIPVFPLSVKSFPTKKTKMIKNPYKYKIALIPMSIPKRYFEFVSKPVESKVLNIPRIKSQFSEEVAKTLISKIQWACDESAKIICCSEYCYPILSDTELRKELVALSKKYHNYIIAGSYAATTPNEPAYNTCLIFTPSPSGPICHYKNELGKIWGDWEQIEVPPIPLQNIKVLHTQYGTLAIILCVEIMSENIRAGLRYINHNRTLYEPVDIIIVPAYTSEAASLQKRCLYISDQTKTCVVYVNDITHDDFSKVYICGEDQYECLNSLQKEKIDAAYGPVHLYSVNLNMIRNERIKQFTGEPFIEKV